MPATGDRITKRKDGRYMARFTVQMPDGPKRKTIYGKAYKEVEDALAKARGDAARGLIFDAGNLTVGEWADRWLRDAVADTVRPVTLAKYEQIVRKHIKPTLGRLKLTALTPTHVRGLYREKLGDGLSPRTVQYIHVTLNKALKQAVADGLIPRNVCEAVKPPRGRREAQARRPLGGRGLVFPNRTGGFLSPYLLTDGPLKRSLERAGLPADPLSRPPAYVRHDPAVSRRPRKARAGAPGSRDRQHHSRHL